MKEFYISLIFLTGIILIPIENAHCQSREQWQPPEQIMDAIGVKPGMTIGDAGAGRGYLTFPLAERVGDKGKIYANDISHQSLNIIETRAKNEGFKNVETIMGEIEDPLFPEKNLDMIILLYVLHMLDKPLIFMENVKKYMGESTSLVIIERDTNIERAHPPSFMSNNQVIKTMQNSNYILEKTLTFLPRDTIYIFKLKDA